MVKSQAGTIPIYSYALLGDNSLFSLSTKTLSPEAKAEERQEAVIQFNPGYFFFHQQLAQVAKNESPTFILYQLLVVPR